MVAQVPQPNWRRVLSIVWFPFFFAAAMSLLFSATFANPHLRTPRVAVGQGVLAGTLQTALESDEQPYSTVRLSPERVRQDVADGSAAAGIVCSGNDCQVLVSSAAARARAALLGPDLSRLAGRALTDPVSVEDVRPLQSGDTSGSGVFFFALPLAMVGMVTSIMLLQLPMWGSRPRFTLIAAVGVFSVATDSLIALARDVLPWDPLIALAGLLLVQAIAWTTTGLAPFVRQFFVPVALTFVLVLGVPTSTGTVSLDMLPDWLAALHHVMPLGAFVDVIRSRAYGIGSSGVPALVLAAWCVLGLVLMTLAHRRRQATHQPRPVPSTPAETKAPRSHELTGIVTRLSGEPLAGASVIVLDAAGEEIERALTDHEGRYDVGAVTAGLHHVVVTARHCEPAIVSVVLSGSRSATHRDIRIEDWNDPAANLTAGQAG